MAFSDLVDDLTTCELPKISRGWSEDGDLVAIDPPKNPEPLAQQNYEVEMFAYPCKDEGWVGQMYWYAPDMRANVVRVRNKNTNQSGWMAWTADLPDIKKYIETNDPGRFRKVCPYNSKLYADDPNCKAEEIIPPKPTPKKGNMALILGVGAASGGILGLAAKTGGYVKASKMATVLGGAVVGLLGGLAFNAAYNRSLAAKSAANVTAGIGAMRQRQRARREVQKYGLNLGYVPQSILVSWDRKGGTGMLDDDGVKRYY